MQTEGEETNTELDEVVEKDREGDDKGLAGLHAVDARKDVDGVRAEHRKHAHKYIVQRSYKHSIGEVWQNEQEFIIGLQEPTIPQGERG